MPLTVLVVDDDAGFRRVVSRLLTMRGFVVVADVADGEAAVAAVRRLRPDGVLLDVNLPDQDGLCLSQALTTPSGAPAVVLTSTDSSGFSGPTLAGSGARAFVAKDRLADADLRTLFSAGGT